MNDEAALRARLAGLSGDALWRAMDAAADTPAFRRMLRAEYPSLAAARGPGRRRFLSVLAASFALGGLSGCGKTRQTDDRRRIIPYVRQPTNVVASAAQTYSSAAVFDGLANGVCVTTRDGRPIKIEGNPEHPWSRGGTDIFAQASVLGLYDPDRSQSVRQLDRSSDWPSFAAAMNPEMAALRARGGEGLRLLTPPVSAPSLLKQIAAMRQALPQMQWHTHAPVGRDGLYEGARQAFGRPLETRWRFDRARVVVAVDGDFLDPGPHQVGAAREWSDARRQAAAEGRLLALHAAGPTPGLTSAKADFPAVVPAAALPALIAALEQAATGGSVPADAPAADWVKRAGAALRDANGAGIVTIGAFQPPSLQAAVHGLNARLGHTGKTVFHTAPALSLGADLATLTQDMHAGRVRAVFMLDSNPVYAAPAALGFAEALARVPLKLHAGSHLDETAIRADWHLPLKHPLESWGDPRALDGTVTLMQPTITPLYEGRTVGEIVSLLTEPQPRDDLDLLRAGWTADAARWQSWLLAGFMADTALPEESATPLSAAGATTAAAGTAVAGRGLRVLFRPDPTVWDGAPANNGWLQELPKPLTKLTWENAIAIAPALAARETLATGDIAALEVGDRILSGPVWVLPGQAEDAVTVTLGYGRQAGGGVTTGLGHDAYQLLPHAGWEAIGATLRGADARRGLATTQEHHAIDGEGLVRVQAIGGAPVGDQAAFDQPSFIPRSETDGRSWGMVIDVDSCIGCNACVVACQAENNIPVVGRDQVIQGREMHWLRIDRYYADAAGDHARTHFMPVPCMHCETAPCEMGCPVEATLHDHEGLNLQVYNRCIGTRACSSDCPYKVRHFNYLDYTADLAPAIEAQQNPDVTVRARGVMEKCTYCVQRIAQARITSDREDAPIPEGSVQTACQQGCPTRAISFGDLARPDSAVAAARRDARNYALLGELNTRPHTTYLAALAPAKG